MPVTVIVKMRALSGDSVPRSFHALFHPVLLDRISRTDSGLARYVHDSGGMAPFSISPVLGRTVKGRLVENETYAVRLCLLKEEMEEAFLGTLDSGLWNGPIELAGRPFQVEEIVLGEQEGNPWTGRTSYENLMLQSSGVAKMSIRLESPTAFRRGDVHYPLPEPSLVFGNLARRWNLFSPFNLPERLDCSDVSYAFLNLRTEPFALRKGGTVLGAVGKLTFIFKGNVEERCIYQALLRFAFYAGIGVKTGQGMGTCRVIENTDRHRRKGSR